VALLVLALGAYTLHVESASNATQSSLEARLERAHADSQIQSIAVSYAQRLIGYGRGVSTLGVTEAGCTEFPGMVGCEGNRIPLGGGLVTATLQGKRGAKASAPWLSSKTVLLAPIGWQVECYRAVVEDLQNVDIPSPGKGWSSIQVRPPSYRAAPDSVETKWGQVKFQCGPAKMSFAEEGGGWYISGVEPLAQAPGA
jgi:hypothetical protein